MPKSVILAAVGRLPQDMAVLRRAIELVKNHDADFWVAHVLDLPGDPSELDDASTFLGQAAFAARDRIEAALLELGVEKSQVSIRIEAGAHALTLIDLCRQVDPALVVMRAHQKRKISERLLGSTTERVIAAASTPVLVVKTKAEAPYARAVVATNGTDEALDLMRFVSQQLPGVKLRLLQVVHIPRQLKEAMLRTGAGKVAFADHREQLILKAEEHLRLLVSKSDVSIQPAVAKGDPAKTLVAYCQDQNMDLIAMGQARKNLVSRAFIGSVSRRVLRDADCDVLIS
ncbi:universal stress protein [Litoreibacter arenae]|uniref:Universal stress protein family 4 n=1 Tax=Litoreibacter arenae DSM 19593 TaxID=1123360 RepID=S9QF85_9RHOB|nr:universal stress protein [Litoreibacter arenae]EPX78253.1 Universal stress protein family 4 [Litoreibacter arenae DSM 19593]